MVEGDGNLHRLVLLVGVAVAQQHHLQHAEILLEMVTAVEPMMASTRPSAQLERELWSTQTWLEPKMEMASPSAMVRHP
ncbi:unnamed protein product [Spirodela intermedia]|uniref:Uncharacterized protein n=1 Tax=Spirodela intermedia TaxID=51605 RepID=A0A7I8KZR7_SPIIN|nr:unnamed protein product [Spirodela intermedia]